MEYQTTILHVVVDREDEGLTVDDDRQTTDISRPQQIPTGRWTQFMEGHIHTTEQTTTARVGGRVQRPRA